MKYIILGVLSLLMTVLPASAQSGKAVVYGKLLDVSSGEPLIGANVVVLNTDSSFVTGSNSLKDGSFAVSKLEKGSYIVKVTYVGYNTFTRNVTIAKKSENHNCGTIMMSESATMLAGATVTGQLPQVEVKEDTLIFNADAFKVPEGSVLEELIRKLPGAEISSDGTVKINGKTVSKILVDGKEFFSNDRNMALKNLPTEIVDKVKSYDKQSDLTRMTGIDDGEEETVLDVTIKKGKKKGWFGNVDLAYGTEERYSEKIMAARFANEHQVALIGSTNNVNDASFPGGGGRGGGGGSGETKSSMVGLNMAYEKDDLIDIEGNIRYSYRDSYSRSKSSVQNFVSTASSYSNSLSRNNSDNGNFSSNFKIEWEIDTLTRIMFRPGLSLTNSGSDGNNSSAAFSSSPYYDGVTDPLNQMDLIPDTSKVNYNQSMSASDSKTLNLSGSLIFNRRLSANRRNLSLRFSGNYSNTKNYSHNASNVTYYQRGDSTALTFRYRETPNWSKNFTAGFTYTEPIAKATYLQLNYQYRYQKRHSDGKTYDLGGLENMLDSLSQYGTLFLPYNYRDYLSDNLSRYTDNENNIHNIELSLRRVTNNYNLNIGLNIQPQRQKVVYDYQNVDTTATRTFLHISPTLNFRYRFSKQHSFRITYRGTTSEPEITSLFNMTDNSDPLNIRLGNPDLKPSFTNNINFTYNNYIQYYQRNINAGFQLRTTSNSISNRTEYNSETGGQITKPMNINGNWNISGNIGYNEPIFLENLYLNTSTSASYNNQVSYFYQNKETMKNHVKNFGLGERLSLTLRKDYFDVMINGSLNYTNMRSELVPANNRDTYDFSYGLATNIYLNSGFSLSTNLSMSSRRGYSSSEMNTNELIWNAQVSYRFLKNKAATLSLQAYDILNRRSNISRQISATRRSDTETNAIYSYAMLHFIYRVNFFGGRRSSGDGEMRRGGGREYDGERENGGFGGGRGGRDGGGGFGGGRGDRF